MLQNFTRDFRAIRREETLSASVRRISAKSKRAREAITYPPTRAMLKLPASDVHGGNRIKPRSSVQMNMRERGAPTIVLVTMQYYIN